MTRLVVRGFSISLDGYGAGPEQSLENPLGIGGPNLAGWLFHTAEFRGVHGGGGGDTTGTDQAYAVKAMAGLGAWVMGRHMFTWERGEWRDADWRGWWGDVPPYHCPVFVLTHYPRPPLEMEGGTVFHFVTGGLDEALARAREAAGGRDIRLGGGVATLRAALERRLVDEMHLAVAPVLLGRGEAVFAGLDLPALGYRVTGSEAGEQATHVTLARG
jgi:dihydrofolate reductase